MVRSLGWVVVSCALVTACSGVDGSDGEAGIAGTKGADGVGTPGEQGPRGEPGEPGANGGNGPPGANGSLRVYGDGSAGPMTIAANTTWPNEPPPNNNYQFTDLTIAAGGSLTVESGTVIRCTGTFKNEGTLFVTVGALAGRATKSDNSFTFTPPTLGNARNAPANGDVAPRDQFALGGYGGIGVGSARAPLLLDPGLFGGSGGASSAGVSFVGSGGGSLVVLAGGGITNGPSAEIRARAMHLNSGGGGGGGGGIVILASKASVTQTGKIDVSGGIGGNGSGDHIAPGGGGSGGFVHLLAPVVTSTGTVELAGGAAGTSTGVFNGAVRVGGGGGGGSYSNGGAGASIGANNQISTAAQSGSVGAVIVSKLDPTSLF